MIISEFSNNCRYRWGRTGDFVRERTVRPRHQYDHGSSPYEIIEGNQPIESCSPSTFFWAVEIQGTRIDQYQYIT